MVICKTKFETLADVQRAGNVERNERVGQCPVLIQ